MSTLLRVLGLILCMALSIYGLYCAYYMGKFVGSEHYWSTPWFYKAHACFFALIALRVLVERLPAERIGDGK